MYSQYTLEKLNPEKCWNALCIQYEQAGMTQDAIDQLHAFDWQWIRSSLRYINNLTELPRNTTMEGLLFWDRNRTGGRPPQNHKVTIETLRDDFLNNNPHLICEKRIIDVKEIVHNAEIALRTKKSI